MSVDAVKDSKPLQNVSSMKPEPSATKAVLDQVTPKVPVEANEATESPAVSRKSPVATPPPVEQNRKLVTKELKEFGHNFKVRFSVLTFKEISLNWGNFDLFNSF